MRTTPTIRLACDAAMAPCMTKSVWVVCLMRSEVEERASCAPTPGCLSAGGRSRVRSGGGPRVFLGPLRPRPLIPLQPIDAAVEGRIAARENHEEERVDAGTAARAI